MKAYYRISIAMNTNEGVVNWWNIFKRACNNNRDNSPHAILFSFVDIPLSTKPFSARVRNWRKDAEFSWKEIRRDDLKSKVDSSKRYVQDWTTTATLHCYWNCATPEISSPEVSWHSTPKTVAHTKFNTQIKQSALIVTIRQRRVSWYAFYCRCQISSRLLSPKATSRRHENSSIQKQWNRSIMYKNVLPAFA